MSANSVHPWSLTTSCLNVLFLSIFMSWAWGCTGASQELAPQPSASATQPDGGGETHTPDQATNYTGTVRLDGVPHMGADLFLLDAQGTVQAVTHTDDKGSYTLPPLQAGGTGWVFARVFSPLLGAHAVAVTAPRVLDVEFSTAQAHTLRGALTLPDNIPLEWVDIHITPRNLEGLPDTTHKALLAVDTGPSIRGVYHTIRATQPQIEIKVMPGLYDLRAERIIEGGLSPNPPTNLTLERVSVTPNRTVTPKSGGFEFEIKQDTTATLTMVVHQEP